MRTAICTLAVNEHKVKDCMNLIETVKQNTGCEVYVYNANNTIDYENVIPLESVTDLPLKHIKVFNYNLKGVITHHCYFNTDYDRIIYADCDVMITEPTDIFETDFKDCDFCAKYERFTITHKNTPSWPKYKKLMAELSEMPQDDFFLGMPYANEAFMLLNRSKNTDEFLELWNEICVRSSKAGILPAFECVELGMALHFSENLVMENLRGGFLRENMLLMTAHRGRNLAVVRR